jgi:predicted TIM-barrel fold metal-dependent hydrolase
VLSESNLARLLPSADCHFHVIDHTRFPFPGGQGYTPRRDESGTVDELKACMARHGVTHGLAVQPSGYGFDNAALLDALERGGGRLRGVAVVPADATMTELRRLFAAGVVGVRFNLTDFDAGGLAQEGATRLLERITGLGWFAEVQCAAADFPPVAALAERTGVRLLIDHLGGPDPRQGIDQPGFRALLRMGGTGRAVVKLSGAFRRSRAPYPHVDLDDVVRALLDAFTPQRCVWGSDWPFINWAEKPDYGNMLTLLTRWVPDQRDRRTILWDTPAGLFGWGEGT